ncbi:YybH family protein [Flagellimonas abyssi]|uniref:Nuclear transport factor 2 family protein n=1 Tax=Flagellimonas abyssi TaxID=2864871 RepID=A0ABS7EP13_9FLAO|nr:nuclear transport factor 2 family protein [Allomuricauda abyssi]MBW8199286.1 nuclear transport factor 2 family protein [Allomuricauda abyssi]
MKHQFIFGIATLLIIVFATSCEQPTPKPMSGEAYSAEIQKIIEEKNEKIEGFYASGMIDSAAVHFADNSIQFMPNQPAVIGVENYKAAWKQNIQFGTWEFDLNTQEVKASGDLATEYGKYTMIFTPNENSPIPAMEDKGNYMVLWEKMDGDWKVVWDAPVTELPLPGQTPDSTMVE